MAAKKENAVLPSDEVSRLRSLRNSENPDADTRLRGRVLALRDAGWPLRAIGDAIDLSRMTIQVWETRARQVEAVTAVASGETDVPVLPLDTRGSGTLERRMVVDIPFGERERLRNLSSQAKTVRRWTPADASERAASIELDTLLTRYIRRGVTPMVIARHAGVTRRAIVARLERIADRETVNA